MSNDREDLELTPTQDLFVEVLIARHRLGEAVWTFDRRHRRTAEQLADLRLIGWKYGVVENTILAWLTDAGKEHGMSYGYIPPILNTGEVTLQPYPQVST